MGGSNNDEKLILKCRSWYGGRSRFLFKLHCRPFPRYEQPSNGLKHKTRELILFVLGGNFTAVTGHGYVRLNQF